LQCVSLLDPCSSPADSPRRAEYYLGDCAFKKIEYAAEGNASEAEQQRWGHDALYIAGLGKRDQIHGDKISISMRTSVIGYPVTE
jgi:hypothetical protein